MDIGELFVKRGLVTRDQLNAASPQAAGRRIDVVLVEQGIISEETALLYCSKRGPVTRAIDNMKKARGESTTQLNGLRMKAPATMGKPSAPAIPASLKLK